jgi:hypothetical protein
MVPGVVSDFDEPLFFQIVSGLTRTRPVSSLKTPRKANWRKERKMHVKKTFLAKCWHFLMQTNIRSQIWMTKKPTESL